VAASLDLEHRRRSGPARYRTDVKRFFDRRRRLMLRLFALGWGLLAVLWPSLNGYQDVGLAGLPVALIALRMSMLEVVADASGVCIKGFFRNHFLRWEDISHFELKRFAMRERSVPSVVTKSGSRFALQGIDSAFSGFGAESREWHLVLEELTRRLDDQRYRRS
jgi:hypothetical protein